MYLYILEHTSTYIECIGIVQNISILSFTKISSSRTDRRLRVLKHIRNSEDEKKSQELTREQFNAAQLSIATLNLEVTDLQQLLSKAQKRIKNSKSRADSLNYRLSIALNR